MEELVIRFTVFRVRLLVCVFSSFPFGFQDGMCDLFVLIPIIAFYLHFITFQWLTIEIFGKFNKYAKNVNVSVLFCFHGVALVEP